MQILGHGIDVVDVKSIHERIRSEDKRWELAVYSQAERDFADPAPIDVRYYAGRFAVKEAVAKALGTGFAGDVTWEGIEVLRGASGEASIRLSGGPLRCATIKGITGWLVSISHCGEIVTASVIATGD